MGCFPGSIFSKIVPEEWTDAGLFLYPTDGPTKNVVIGAILMSASEKLRIVGEGRFEGNITIRPVSGAAQGLRLYEDAGVNYTVIKSAPAQAADLTITLPSGAGADGEVLTKQAGGETQWEAIPVQAQEWTDGGGWLYPTDGAGQEVAIGAVTMAGAEKLRVVGDQRNEGNVSVRPVAAAAQALRLYEDAGTNYTAIKAAPVQAADLTITLPSTVGAAGEVLTKQAGGETEWAAPTGGGGGLAFEAFRGLAIVWLSDTTLRVLPGACRNIDNTADITLAAAVTVDLTALGAAGVGTKALTGTVTTNIATTALTGAGTAFLTEFGTRVGTGTAGTGAVPSTTLTLTGGPICEVREVGADDLVGNATVGYARVKTVNTADGITVATLTLHTALTVANGSAWNIIENPTIDGSGSTANRLAAIASDTVATTINNGSATAGGQTAVAGARFTALHAGAVESSAHYYLWLMSGGAGVTVIASTQRTAPFALAGYDDDYRLIGWVRLDETSNFRRGYYRRQGNVLTWISDGIESVDDMVVYNEITVGAWTRSGGSSPAARASSRVPPNATEFAIQVLTLPVAGANIAYVRPYGSPSTYPDVVVPEDDTQGMTLNWTLPNICQDLEWFITPAALSLDVGIIGITIDLAPFAP